MSKAAKVKPAVAVLEVFQIPRQTFMWLLAAVAIVILPHIDHLPLWLIALCALGMAGRVLIHQGRMSLPGNNLKRLAVLLMLALTVVQYGRNMVSTDAMVGLLLMGIALKLLEMQQKRDVLTVIYLCYFTLVTEFIYTQAIPVAVYAVVAAMVITSALLALHQSREKQNPWRAFKLSAIVLLQSAPLMAAFFLLFPRISPLWTMPLQNKTSVTGLSESMAPGDISQLARSAELAFRVQFSGKAPDYSELYWRALTMDEFDGRRWGRGFLLDRQYLGNNVSERDIKPWFRNIGYSGRAVAYNVIAEPNYQNWIYTLQMPQMRDDRYFMSYDYLVGSLRTNTQRFSYDARSYLDFQVDESSRGFALRRARALPELGNVRAREFARKLHADVDGDAAYVQAVLNHFRTQGFSYTLSPRKLGENSVDEFLFDSREGFCEHYAGSFTFLMRAGGVAARVVTGYMGGEYNPYDGTLTVRQYDAHAWAEVWLDGNWVRVDPTAVVAPQRVSQGSNMALKQQKEFMDDAGFSLMRYRDSKLLNDLRLQLEMIDYAWNRFVLNYNQDLQFELFNKIFGQVTKLKIVLTVIGFMALMALGVLFIIFRKSTQAALHPATRHYLQFCDYLASLGVARQIGEAPLHYLQRVSQQYPQWYPELETVTREFIALTYATNNPNPQLLSQFRRHVRRARLLS